MPTIQSSDLIVNQKISAAAPDALLNITIDSQSPLQTGSYEFQLVVVDDSGNNSNPATVKITIADDQAPTAVIDAPSRVGFAKDFSLSGQRSIDIGGELTKFVWTLIKTP
ncbi:hypothetical protein [uncultured Paraglaciecola sp.]|uniref:hypothetical protein n=1 Tax=uncultured Paraglaciecola sp. TaxID=1765024 RepID=UPI0030DA0288|tara:strand:+ start:3826 stop:4155 length:330 start_codon:yes stop_codon:yes gene_type:complete